MADHRVARGAFERLLTSAVPWRFLLLRGPSESGKSHITRQMFSNAFRVPGLACGRFDFKGAIDMDAEVTAFVQDLDVPLPPVGPRLNERLGHILDALKQRSRPALLVFDTYESAGEAEDWVEKQLLPSLIGQPRCEWSLPDSAYPDALAQFGKRMPLRPLRSNKPPSRDWFAYSKGIAPNSPWLR